MTLSQNTAV